MSRVIVIDRCGECPCTEWAGGVTSCWQIDAPASPDVSGFEAGIPDYCPLYSLPESEWEPDDPDSYESGHADGWNDCLNELKSWAGKNWNAETRKIRAGWGIKKQTWDKRADAIIRMLKERFPTIKQVPEEMPFYDVYTKLEWIMTIGLDADLSKDEKEELLMLGDGDGLYYWRSPYGDEIRIKREKRGEEGDDN